MNSNPNPSRGPARPDPGDVDPPFAGAPDTGLYCSAGCDARPPGPAAATRFASAVAAEHAGFAPCPRCRPDLDPGWKGTDPARRLADSVQAVAAARGFRTATAGEVAAQLGTTPAEIESVLREGPGVSLEAHDAACRRMFVRRLLDETALSLADIAAACGLPGTAALRAVLEPGVAVRGRRGGNRAPSVSLVIRYRPPLAWDHLLAFLEGRAIAGVEQVWDGAYWRTVRMAAGGRDHHGWLRVRPANTGHCLEVTVSRSLVPALPAVLQRVRALFDIAANPAEIAACLGSLAGAAPGLRVPGAFEPFEMAVRAILGQQITVKAARTLAGRFAAAFGTPVETPVPGLGTCFPAPATIVVQPVDAIARLGIVGARTRAILALAQALSRHEITLLPHADVGRELARLRALPGIGEWTAQYIAMRALGWPDAFPHTDYGVRKALGTTSDREVLARAEAWRPWRAYAVIHLWHGLASPPAR